MNNKEKLEIVFRIAQNILPKDKFAKFICYCYGVLMSEANNSQVELIEKELSILQYEDINDRMQIFG